MNYRFLPLEIEYFLRGWLLKVVTERKNISSGLKVSKPSI